MRFEEFDLTEDQQKNLLRKRYPHLTEEQLDEILPAIGAIGAGIARAAGAAALRGGAALARGAAKGVGAAARVGTKAAGRVGNKMGQAASNATQKAAQKVGQKATTMLSKQLLKKGAKLALPTNTPGGKEQEFQIDAVTGDEVVINNPKPKPGEPAKTVYKKKDLEPIIKQKAGL